MISEVESATGGPLRWGGPSGGRLRPRFLGGRPLGEPRLGDVAAAAAPAAAVAPSGPLVLGGCLVGELVVLVGDERGGGSWGRGGGRREALVGLLLLALVERGGGFPAGLLTGEVF